MTQNLGKILNIKRFEIHDGDGLRTTLFLKGCPLRCKWCHNPESLAANAEVGFFKDKCTNCGACVNICPYGAHTMENGEHTFDRKKCRTCGKCASVCLSAALKFYGETVSVEDILPKLLEDKSFYQNSGGGVTISGGEPLLQADFCHELLKALKSKGINTAVDTSLFALKANLDKVIMFTDTFLVDIKAFDESVHRELTGQSNKAILENIRYLDSLGKAMEIRIPYIPGLNSNQIEKIARFISTLSSVKGVRVLPYHNLSSTKYNSLELEYTLTNDKVPIPTKEEIDKAEKIIESYNINIFH